MPDENTIKIQPDTTEVGQPQDTKADEAPEEFVLPTQEQLGEMSAEELKAIYPKVIDKYVAGKKMQTAAHYSNTETAKRQKELDEREERLRKYESDLYSKQQEALNQFSVMNKPTPQPLPAPPDRDVDPIGYAEYYKKQAEIKELEYGKQIDEIRREINDTKTQTAAIRMENWVEKNITSKDEYNLVDPMEIELYFRKNPQASTDFPDIMRIAGKIQAQKSSIIEERATARANEILTQKAEAAKNAQILPGNQYGGQKQVKWEELSEDEEDKEIENLVKNLKAQKKGV